MLAVNTSTVLFNLEPHEVVRFDLFYFPWVSSSIAGDAHKTKCRNLLGDYKFEHSLLIRRAQSFRYITIP